MVRSGSLGLQGFACKAVRSSVAVDFSDEELESGCILRNLLTRDYSRVYVTGSFYNRVPIISLSEAPVFWGGCVFFHDLSIQDL